MFCEGTRTEPDYIKALKLEPAVRESASVDIRVDLAASGAVPLTLVNAAAEARARSVQEQGEVDQVWCLFDVEWPRNHPDLPEARAKAEGSGVRLAISNPCFELWLALHLRTTRLGSTTTMPESCVASMTRVRARDWTARSTCRGEAMPLNARVP